MKLVAMLSAVSLAAALGGCGGGTSYSSIKHDLTPELEGTGEREVERDKDAHVTYNVNWRGFHDDMARAFLYDSPSRLSPYPIVNSGPPH